MWVFILDISGVLGQGFLTWHLVPYDHSLHWGKDILISNKTGPDATKQLNKNCAHLVQEVLLLSLLLLFWSTHENPFWCQVDTLVGGGFLLEKECDLSSSLYNK